MSRLLIIGAGGFGRETAELARLLPTWELMGFLDDDLRLAGAVVADLPVLGPVELARDLPDIALVITAGHPGNYFQRKRIVIRLGLADERYATLIHPTAVIAGSCQVGVGSILHAGVVLTTNVKVGRHVAMMPGVVLTHDNVVGDFVTFGAGARLAGRVTISEGAYVGSGASVRQDRIVGAWSLVGMGAVVLHDVPPGEIWAGVPASIVRSAPAPWDLQ